ncbi:uncharacterized protein Cpr51A [Euwallacea fornicatus]|uniref:uncharacterized protein Cpr51A n=1 Tax=Euwallacea fornicatus TaxID=995702 RepID=UPI00338D923F
MLKYLIVLGAVSSFALARPQGTTNANYIPNEVEKQQNVAAKYKFSSDINDHISDLTHQRSEERDGLALKGMYSYSDGYYKRTVHYVADENGYRVTGMEAVPLDGPHVNLAGTASVDAAAHGTHLSYKIQSVPIEGALSKVVGNGQDNVVV